MDKYDFLLFWRKKLGYAHLSLINYWQTDQGMMGILSSLDQQEYEEPYAYLVIQLKSGECWQRDYESGAEAMRVAKLFAVFAGAR